jgi:hypothetical protein
MAALFERLRVWPAIDIDELSQMPEWDEAVRWGWVMHSGELTGLGVAHVIELPRGLLRD